MSSPPSETDSVTEIVAQRARHDGELVPESRTLDTRRIGSPTPDTQPIPEARAVLPELGSFVEGRYRYRLAEPLGSGGFGAVYRAECIDRDPRDPDSPPATVAVKVLGKTPDAQAAGSLKRELAALRSVDDAHIPRVYDWSLDAACDFVALDYYPSGSLADSRATLGHLTENQTWRLLTDLLGALSAAHRAAVLHLDVKPSNVLLDGRGGYALTDFGVAQAARMSKGLLHQGRIAIALGTHGYRAPEQANLSIQSFDLRTDLWGVGATAWSMYTGIDLNSRPDVLRREEDGNIFGLPRVSDVHLRCSPPLEEVIMSLLYIDPTRRPGGAAEVLTLIQAVTQGFGIEAGSMRAPQPAEDVSLEIRELLDSLVDPVWASICRSPGFERFFAKFEAGEEISSPTVRPHHCFLVLRGKVLVEKEGEIVDVEEPEGDLLGAISTLTGAARQVTLRAADEVWVCIFNEAELEQLVTCNPSVSVRMVRAMANRIASGPPRPRD